MVCVVIRLEFNGFSSVNILAHLIGLVKREKNRFKMEDEHILLKKSKKKLSTDLSTKMYIYLLLHVLGIKIRKMKLPRPLPPKSNNFNVLRTQVVLKT